MSNDTYLQNPYIAGGDLYVDAAMKMYSERYGMERHQFLEADDVTWREKGLPMHPRDLFKRGLLSTMYGTSAFGLSTMLDVTVEDAQQFIDDFHESFPIAHQYAKDCHAFVDEFGYCETMGGRKRRFPAYSFTNKKTKETVEVPKHTDLAKMYHSGMAQAERILGEPVTNVWQSDLPFKLKQSLGFATRFYNSNLRQIVNARTQGSAAEAIKKAMISVEKVLQEKGSEWLLIATVHDEILLEIPDTATEEDFRDIEAAMVNAMHLVVPLKTDIAVMQRWSEDVTLDKWLEDGLNCFDEKGFKK